MAIRTRVMSIESKAEGLNGPARIGRVSFSRTLVTIHYRDQSFRRTQGYKYNYIDEKTFEPYWISGPRKDSEDRLYVSNIPVHIDEEGGILAQNPKAPRPPPSKTHLVPV